jgi:Domain of unknown function (DUF4124)
LERFPTGGGPSRPWRWTTKLTWGSSTAHRDLMNRRRACPLIAVFALGLPAAASGELYKWIDESGAVAYGDAPPPRAKSLRVLGKNAGSLSVVPGISPEQLERMREQERELRLRRLELEVEELRLREQALAQAQRDLAYVEPPLSVVWDGGYWPGGYPVGPKVKDKRFWPRYPAHRSRPDLDLLPYQRARLISAPPVVDPRVARR